MQLDELPGHGNTGKGLCHWANVSVLLAFLISVKVVVQIPKGCFQVVPSTRRPSYYWVSHGQWLECHPRTGVMLPSLGDFLDQRPESFLPDPANHDFNKPLPRPDCSLTVSLYASVLVSFAAPCRLYAWVQVKRWGAQVLGRPTHTVYIRRLPVFIQVAMRWADLEAGVMSSKVVVAQSASRLARANVLPGVEEV